MGGGRGCLVQETVHEAEARDTAAVCKGLQLVGDGGRGANQPGGLGLDVVQELEGSGGGTHPDRAAVLHPRSYVGLVDCGESGWEEEGPGSAEKCNGAVCVLGDQRHMRGPG